MAAYEFTALDARGRNSKGLIEGETPRQVRQLLRDRGLTPLDVRAVAEGRSEQRASFSSIVRRGGSFNSTELALFTRQLATLTRSGLPLDEALTAVSQQSESKKVQRVTLGVRARVTEGNSLASSMSEFPGAFPMLFRATIEAGEQAGQLDNVLERLADYADRGQQLRSKLMISLLYPIMLLLVATGVIIALMTYVVPKIVGVFDSIGQQLPPLTRGLIAASDFLRNYGIYLAIGIVVFLFLFFRAMRGEDFRRRVHRQQLRLPLIGRLVRSGNTGRFMRTLGILFGSGVPILEALRIGSQVVTNMPMREAIDDAAKRVREGVSLNKSLAQSHLFPPIALHLIGSGEASGKLDEMLDRAATNQERELETLVAAMVGVMEPMVIVFMGGIVFLIVMAILLPIFDLNQMVK
jgi:general secretion pathway protein F